jgi:hypothetical protein
MAEQATVARVYEDLVNERDRLRGARRNVTAQLGPLPPSAGLIVGLFAAFGDIESDLMALLFGLALVPFVLLTVVSAHALRWKSYREIRKERGCYTLDSDLPEEKWLVTMIECELEIYEELETLYDRERKRLIVVQALLALEVVYLVVITALTPYIT